MSCITGWWKGLFLHRKMDRNEAKDIIGRRNSKKVGKGGRVKIEGKDRKGKEKEKKERIECYRKRGQR